MINGIKIFNEDCFVTIKRLIDNNDSVDVVLTSPPYNNSRTSHTEYCMNTSNCRYDEYNDNMTNDEYCSWTTKLFNEMDKILKPNGVILYNISYGNENPECMWRTLSSIITDTNFTISDTIIWKKKSAFPNNVSPNKLTRLTEFVFVISRKNEFGTYHMNKAVKSVSRTGQSFYENIFNVVEAANNDGPCELNNATYSSELCEKLLSLYVGDVDSTKVVVYDPFMGSGTTAVACKKLGMNCVGSELSSAQCEYANNRLGLIKTKDNSTYAKVSLF